MQAITQFLPPQAWTWFNLVCLAPADGFHLGCRDAAFRQVHLDGIRTVLRQPLVVRNGTKAVGVAVDGDGFKGVDVLEFRRQFVQRFPALGVHGARGTLVEVEQRVCCQVVGLVDLFRLG